MAAAIFAGIGAATGLAQGIFGASDAATSKLGSRGPLREQVKQQEKIAKRLDHIQRRKPFKLIKKITKLSVTTSSKLPNKIGNVRMRFKTSNISNLFVNTRKILASVISSLTSMT
jgi:hypothetical protein